LIAASLINVHKWHTASLLMRSLVAHRKLNDVIMSGSLQVQ